MGLIVALDENSTAAGSFFWDDGESLGGSVAFSVDFPESFLLRAKIDIVRQGLQVWP